VTASIGHRTAPCSELGWRQLRQHRLAASVLATMAVLVIVAKVFLPGRLILNRTASVPRGLYWLTRGAPAERGQIVAFPIPEALRELFRERRLVPTSFFDLLAKPVAALPGDHVCIRDAAVLINQRRVATVRSVDSQERPLPRLELCRRLEPGEIFVITTSDSFDSRYMGPIPTASVLGTLSLLLEF